jgi:hypothetical protein
MTGKVVKSARQLLFCELHSTLLAIPLRFKIRLSLAAYALRQVNSWSSEMASIRKRAQETLDCQPRSVQTLRPGIEQRITAERFVSACFKQHYGAEIVHYMPLLMSLRDQQQRLTAVLGFRHAGCEPLFLENYLDQPVEQLLSAKLKMPVDRNRLVEVGNLAVASAGGGRELITALTAYLSTTTAEWALFTIGPILYNAFTRLGLELIELADARIESLPLEEQACWGSYYEQRPKVMAGNIAHGNKVLWAICQQEQSMRELWQSAEQAGRRVA